MTRELALVVLAGAPATPLERALLERATRWAVEHAAPGAAYLALTSEPHDDTVADGVTVLGAPGAHEGERRAAAFAEAARRSGRPVALVGADMPLLSAHHAWAAADDLHAGVDATFGPATDGGYYLIAAREPHPALFAIDPSAWGGESVMTRTLESALGAGLSVAWLRSERRLTTRADATALLADPTAPPDVVAALRA